MGQWRSIAHGTAPSERIRDWSAGGDVESIGGSIMARRQSRMHRSTMRNLLELDQLLRCLKFLPNCHRLDRALTGSWFRRDSQVDVSGILEEPAAMPASRALRPRIFFLHNPKAGGTSLRNMLLEVIGDGSVAPVFCNASNEHRLTRSSVARFAGYDYYAGHYGFDVYEELATDHRLVTNFRNPVTRIYSLYRYWKHNVSYDHLVTLQGPDAEVVRLAHRHTFSEFIRADENDLRLYIENFHFRQLLETGWDWPTLLEDHIALVKSRIRAMPWFYVTERPTQSHGLFVESFQVTSDLRMPWENKSNGQFDQVSVSDKEYILSLNQLDLAIYEYALDVQDERTSELAKAKAQQ